MNTLRALTVRAGQIERQLEEAASGLNKLRALISETGQRLTAEREALTRERALMKAHAASDVFSAEALREAAEAYFQRQERVIGEIRADVNRLKQTERQAEQAVQTLFAEKERLRILTENLKARLQQEEQAKQTRDLEEVLLLRGARFSANRNASATPEEDEAAPSLSSGTPKP